MDLEIRDERNRRWDEPFGDEPLDAETIGRILALPVFDGVKPDDFPAWLPLELIIANDGRLRRFDRGEAVIRKGDYGNSLFAVLKGQVCGVEAAETEPSRRPRRTRSWRRALARLISPRTVPEFRPARRALRAPAGRPRGSVPLSAETDRRAGIDLDAAAISFTLSAPEIFGELAALTRSPRSVSVFGAADDTLLFELRWQGLRDIRTWSEAFRQRIDGLYQQRGLVTRLQECPVFAHVDRDAIDLIARESLFETYGTFDWTHRFKTEIGRHADTGHMIGHEQVICSQGDHVDGLLLINTGFARVSQRVDQGERTIGHLARNDVFGLSEIARAAASDHAGSLDAGLRAIGYVDIIRIPTRLVRTHVLPGLPAGFADRHQVGELHGGREKMRQAMMDFVVDRRFINGENAMVINLDRCVGCDDCVRACAATHDNNPRFIRHGHSFENAMIANACMHCTDPVCLIGCPTGAIHRAPDTGNVIINDATCIGCGTCANSCPYNNIRMVEIRDGAGAFMTDRDGEPISRATKCDLCADQLTGPACAAACPHDALARINIRDTGALLKWLG